MDLPREEERTPYVGPRPIQTGELLFGRDRDVRDLVALLVSKRIVLLHSPSGAGKSSLVNAGLIPALHTRPFVILPVVRVNREAPDRVASMVRPGANRYILSTLLSLEGHREPRQRVELSTLVRLSLSEYLELRESEIEGRKAILLIFDQFEEILTLDPIDLGTRQAFFEEVGEALRSRRRTALFAMREDYVGGLDPYLQPVPTQLGVRMRLDLLDIQSARQAIQRPRAENADEAVAFLTDNFTPEAAEQLAKDLTQMRVQQPDGTRLLRNGIYVEPVQLQVVCERLWKQAEQNGLPQVDVEALKDAGTVDEALSGYFADSVARIAASWHVPQWRIRDWFGQRLITAQGIRGQIMRDVGASEGLENEVIEDLIRAYLVRQEQRRGVTWYELAHDRLVDPILQDNERWRQKNLSPYYARAARWASESPPPKEMLLRGLELAEMEQWETNYPDKMTYDEEALLEASRKARDEVQIGASREAGRRTNLAETGWGVIFADPSLRPALAELLDHRQALATGTNPDYYQEFFYQAGETAQQFLARNGIGTGALEPERVPYYLLLVGDPEAIPWEFQYELDLQYAVGRIHFDTPGELAAYARSVVVAEQGDVSLPPSAVLFSTAYQDDQAMDLALNSVVVPMGERLRGARLQPEWEIQPILGEQATKERLGRLLGGDETPALLVSFVRGLPLSTEDTTLPDSLGAIVCHEWPGPRAWKGALVPEFYFGAGDVPDEAQLLGLVVFYSGSYSAGVPGRDDFAHRHGARFSPYERPLVSRLPQRLLGHPRGGALAVCGHVDRPWLVEGGIAEMPIFAEVVRRLMDGYTVGSAMEVFDQRYAVFAARSSEVLRRKMAPRKGESELAGWELETLLTAMVDARNYVIFGDPAVRLPVVDAAQAAPRPVIEPISLPVEPETPEAEPLEAIRKARLEREPVMAVSDVRAAYVDLELCLYRQEAEGYGVQMRLTQSEPGVAIDLVSPGTARMRIDMEALDAAFDSQGELLSQGLFEDPVVRDAFVSTRASAQAQGIPLRLRLYLDPAAPELHTLPWEAMDDPLQPGSRLALADDVLFSRFATSPDWRPVQLRPRADLKALVVMANPADATQFGFPAMDIDLELAVAESSLGAIPTDMLTDPGTATLDNLVMHLQDGYDVLYLACHTAAIHGQPHIWLEDEQGNSHAVSGSELVARWRELRQMPRLVVWMARDAAVFGPSLLEAGVPAVLATTGAITTATAKEVMAVFFEQVLRHGLIDRAVAVARQAVRDRHDGSSLALFMRSMSGRLFAETVVDAPFMAPSLPPDYVPRPAELEPVVDLLLASGEEAPVVALTGAGGSGKSVLAAAVCHDQRTRDALTGGILWVSLGQQPDLTYLLGTLVAAITGDQPGFTSLEAVSAVWVQALAERRMLLVVDDAWDAEHLAPFLAGGPHCTRLITTRNRSLVPLEAYLVEIGAMNPDDAVMLLAAGVPKVDLSALRPLAERLEMWPLALKLANAALRDRIKKGQGLSDAIAYLNRALDRQGVTAFDGRGFDQSLGRSLELLLERLDSDAAQRYLELAAFPEDTAVPLDAVQVLWGATAGLGASQVEALCVRFRDLSLLDLDLEARQLRLHDVLRSYLLSNRVKPGSAHEALLRAYRTTYQIRWWADLPRDEPYLWQHLAYHLAGVGDLGGLKDLFLGFDWLQAKLEVAGVAALLSDFGHWSGDDESVPLVRGALQLAQHILAENPAQLAAQLISRLSYYTAPGIRALLQAAGERQDEPWLRPLSPGLIPPGGPLLRSLVGHDGPVTAVALTPDGHRILSASWDRTLRVWDLESGALLQTLAGHSEGLTGVAVTPDGRCAVTASNDTTLKVWDLGTGAVLRNLTGHAAPVAAVAITPDGGRAVSASGDCTLRLWDIQTGDCLRTLQDHAGPVTALALTPDGERIVSASADGTLGIWDLETGEQASRLEGNMGPLWGVAATPDGRLAISSSDDGELSVWDLEKAVLVTTWEGHAGGRTAVATVPGGRYALSASADGTLKIWEPFLTARKGQGGRDLATLRGHNGLVTAVASTPDGQLVISASDDGTLKVWDLQRALEMQIEPAHGGPVRAVTFSPDGKRALTGAGDGLLKLWDLEKREIERTLEGHKDSLVAAAFTPDGRQVISASLDRTLKLWDLGFIGQVSTIRKRLTQGLIKGSAAEYAARGREAAPQALKSDMTSGEEARSWDLPEVMNDLAIDQNGKYIVTACRDGSLKVWDYREVLGHGLKEGKELCSLHGHEGAVWSVALFDAGRRAISAGEDGTLRIWDLDTGQELHTLSGHAGAVHAVAIGGASLVMAFEGDALAMLDDGRVMDSEGEALDALPGGQFAVSCSADHTLKVWDLEAGRELATLTGHAGPVKSVAVAPDGHWAVSASDDGTLRAWDLPRALAAGARSPAAVSFSGELILDSVAEVLMDTFGGDSAFSACAMSGDGTIVAGDLTGQVHLMKLAEPPPTRTVRIGLHGRVGAPWDEADYALIREAGIETVKLLSNTDLAVFERLKRENPELEFLVRLFDNRIGLGGHPTPKMFVERMIPVMQSLRPHATRFEIHSEPDALGGGEGWGATDKDAAAFNEWFVKVYDLLKAAHPWAQLGFPGLAEFIHKNRSWLDVCRPAIERADWLGVHAYWMTGPDRVSGMLDLGYGLVFRTYHELFPDKRIVITEFGGSLAADVSFSEERMAGEMVAYYQELYKYDYLNSACAFCLSTPDPVWQSLAWREEDGYMRRVIQRVRDMYRADLSR